MFEGRKTAGPASSTSEPHQLLLLLLWAHVPALAVVGLLIGRTVEEVALASLVLIAFAVGGSTLTRGRLNVIAVTLGLLAASAVVVDYAAGSLISHFHFFLMICAISFYRNSQMLVLGVLAVLGYHVGVPGPVASLSATVTHSGAVVALSLLLVLGWRLDKPSTATGGTSETFRISFEAAPIGMAVAKPSGELIEVNRAMADLLGHDPVRLIGANVTSLVHVDDQADLGEAWEEMGNSRAHASSKWMRCVTAEGHHVWGRMSLSLVPRTDEHPALVVLQLEDAGQAHEEQLRLENLLKGKDEFVAAVGDEIREPLGLLIDLTDVADHPHVVERDTLPRIEAHAREIASIVDDLVISARADRSPVSVIAHHVDAGDLCREVMARVPGAEDIALDVRATDMWADPALARRILTSLLMNAVRYGGPSISVGTVSSGPDTVIQVADDGPEIPFEERDRLFQGDLRSGQPVTRPAAVGLGLTVSRHLARLMDGEVVYRRTRDGFNLFELRLPSEQISELPRRRGVMQEV